MDMLALADEIIAGRRISREDDLNMFLTCDLKELCKGADRIREYFVGEKVDLCSIINVRSGKCSEALGNNKTVKLCSEFNSFVFTVLCFSSRQPAERKIHAHQNRVCSHG